MSRLFLAVRRVHGRPHLPGQERASHERICESTESRCSTRAAVHPGSGRPPQLNARCSRFPAQGATSAGFRRACKWPSSWSSRRSRFTSAGCGRSSPRAGRFTPTSSRSCWRRWATWGWPATCSTRSAAPRRSTPRRPCPSTRGTSRAGSVPTSRSASRGCRSQWCSILTCRLSIRRAAPSHCSWG